MRYTNVCIEALGYTLPELVVTSDEIEERLAPLYGRLKLPAGRLELMTGIRERRFWDEGTLPSEKSIESAEKAIAAAGIDRRQIGALVHGSVCRDYLEPATASGVHHALGLPAECMIYDVSNACLGILNGMLQVANMIELGQIEAGLVVGSEGGRQLVDTTIEALNRDDTLTRDATKSAFASLTIGSASAAILLTSRRLSRTGNVLRAAVARANTEHHDLCRSGRDESVGGGMRPMMNTDSERLMREGIATGVATLAAFLAEADLDLEEINKTVCHQVGAAHRRTMLESLALNPEMDFATVEFLGNTGAAALPVTMALAVESGHIRPDDTVAMLGIGSGINCVMCAVDWQTAPLAPPASEPGELAEKRLIASRAPGDFE